MSAAANGNDRDQRTAGRRAYDSRVSRAAVAASTQRRGRSGRGRAGVAGNARLTATTAAALFILLAAEGVTILQIGPLLSAHVFIGMVLVPPVALKIGATFYRFARYYLGHPAYKEKGPPPIALRVLGPGVVVTTVALFATGIAALFATGSLLSELITLHKASFVLWFCAMAVHVLGHIIETARLAPRDFLAATRHKVSGANARNFSLLASIGIGIALGAALLKDVPIFLHHYTGGH